MSEWWTYRPSDFLLFSARTYWRLFELHNAAHGPAPFITLALGCVVALALWRRWAWGPRVAFVVFGLAWIWVGWAFHAERFAAINWVATAYAVAFAVQGAILLMAAAIVPSAASHAPSSTERSIGLVLMLVALLQPALAPLSGRPWQQAEVWAMAPDPTVLGTLGLLLAVPGLRGVWRWLIWPIPLLWCAVTGMTLATMGAGEALLLPAAGLIAVATALRTRWPFDRSTSA